MVEMRDIGQRCRDATRQGGIVRKKKAKNKRL